MRVTSAKTGLRVGVSILALSLGAIWSTDSLAQSAEVETLVVTARKREENLQDVPLAIAAYSAGELAKAGVTNLETLAAATPGLAAQSLGGTYQAPVIRGLAQIDQSAAIGNVGVFVDGIYLNNRSGQEFGFMDLARIEVVKGPQSALYGRNTFSGAINYVSKAPILGSYDGYLTGEVGNYDRWSVQGSVSVPIGENAAVRLFGGRGQFDGTIDNVRDGGHLGGWENKSTYGASLLFEPSDVVTVRAFYMRNDVKNDQPGFRFMDPLNNNCGSIAQTPVGELYTLYCGKLPYPDDVDLLSNPAHGLVGFSAVSYVSVDREFDFGSLNFTFGYQNARFAQLNDQVGRAEAINQPLATNPLYSQQTFLEAVGKGSDQYSYDLRWDSPADQPIRYMIGLTYFDSKTDDRLQSFNTLLGNLNSRVLASGRGGLMNIVGRAAYGQVEWDVTDELTLVAEGRYSIEDQEFSNVTAAGVQSGKQDYSYFTPRLTATYALTPFSNVYGSIAKGYKLGGFNSNAWQKEQYTYGAESNWTYELGYKATLFDGKLQMDASVYYVDWSDLQVQSNIPGVEQIVVVNNLGATSYGIEGTFTYNITDDFWVRAGVTLLDPTYKDGTRDGEVFAPCGEVPNSTIIEKGCDSDVGGNQLSRTTKSQFALAAEYTWPALVAGFDAYVRGDYSWQEGKHYLSLMQDDQGDISLANMTVGLQNENYEFSFWVKNLFDEEYLARSTSTAAGVAYGTPPSGVLATRLYPGEKRTIGVRATYKFY